MTIKKLVEYKGASRFGTCNECGIGESEAHNLYRIQFNQVKQTSICLCADCLKKAKELLYEFNGN